MLCRSRDNPRAVRKGSRDCNPLVRLRQQVGTKEVKVRIVWVVPLVFS
jgi:hypothetical protein